MSEEQLPNFLICGAAKAATTTVWAVLREHPDVYMPAYKDPSFFNAGHPESRWGRGLDWYRGLFAMASGERRIGEASTAYLIDPEAPRLIRETLGPAVRLIFVFRDPVDRGYSHYWQNKKSQPDIPTFTEVVEHEIEGLFSLLVENGKYATHLRRYLNVFPKESILCLRFEALEKEPERFYGEICDFLEVDRLETREQVRKKKNPAARPRFNALEKHVLRSPFLLRIARRLTPDRFYDQARVLLKRMKQANRVPFDYPPIPERGERRLYEVLRPEIDDLEQLLGWDLSTWRDHPARRLTTS